MADLRRTMLFRLGSRDRGWSYVLGIFLFLITFLLFIKSAAVMFDSWQTIRDFNKCVEVSGVNDFDQLSSAEQLLAQLRYGDCKDSLYEITGAQVPASQKSLTSRQAATALVGPVAWLLFWAGLVFASLVLVTNRSLILPVEEVELPSRPLRRR